MLRTTANILAAGLLVLGMLHSSEVIEPSRAIDGKQSLVGNAFKNNSVHARYHQLCCALCPHHAKKKKYNVPWTARWSKATWRRWDETIKAIFCFSQCHMWILQCHSTYSPGCPPQDRTNSHWRSVMKLWHRPQYLLKPLVFGEVHHVKKTWKKIHSF